jgi:hypothetical protein
MPQLDDDEPDYDHETILEQVMRALLTSDELEQLCVDADTATLLDDDGDLVWITSALTCAEAGVLTHDKDVYLELSDGSRFGLTISIASRGHGETTARRLA